MNLQKRLDARAQASSDGTFTFIASTATLDRDGDSINQSGWDLTAFQRNPVILFGHDAKSPPVGRAVDIGVVNGQLRVRVEFAPPDVSSAAAEIGRLVGAGYLNSVSVGFRVLDSRPLPNGGTEFTKVELLEISVVPVPANSEALVISRSATGTRQAVESWVQRSGRVLSGQNEEHVRAALDHATNAAERLTSVLNSMPEESGQNDDKMLDDDEVMAVMGAEVPGIITAEVRQVVQREVGRAMASLRGRMVDPTADPFARRSFSIPASEDTGITRAEATLIVRGAVRAALGEVVRMQTQSVLNKMRGRLD